MVLPPIATAARGGPLDIGSFSASRISILFVRFAKFSDASVSSVLGSQLQRRKKKALERTTSLTNAFTADDVGLPSPETTAAEESKDNDDTKPAKEADSIKTKSINSDVVETKAGEDDDVFDEAFREALEGSE